MIVTSKDEGVLVVAGPLELLKKNLMNIKRLSIWMFSLDHSVLLLLPHQIRIFQLLLSEKIHLDEGVTARSTKLLLK